MKFKPDNATNDEVFGAKVLFDVDVGYQITKNILLRGRRRQRCSTRSRTSRTKDANTSFGRFVYSRNVSQIDQNGGFYYAKPELTFF